MRFGKTYGQDFEHNPTVPFYAKVGISKSFWWKDEQENWKDIISCNGNYKRYPFACRTVIAD